MGFLAFALLLPESSHAGGSAEFPGFGLLALGYTDGVLETRFRFSGILRRALQQECTFETVQFRFIETLTTAVHECQRFRERRQSCRWLSPNPLCFGEE